MKPSAALAAVVVALAAILVLIVMRGSESAAEPQPTPAPPLPAATQTSWLAPTLGPEPNAYDPNRWWRPSNNNGPCDGPDCPR